uniref:Islet cell autoantigen Ica1 C-terminal domain-containing protein n=3 Tax=Stomoxys calcitrans TaxID=35570 RepID=A0A1I8QCU2_STOCA
MFSHVLVSYIAELKNFSQKTSATFDTVSKALDQRPKYDFYILKELTQHEEVHEDIIRISAFNNDQALLFASDYLDTTEKNLPDCQDKASDAVENVPLIELSRDDDILDLCSKDDSIDVGTTLPKNGCNKSQSHGPDIFMFKPKEESILSSSSSTVLATPQSALETLVSRPNSCQQESSSTKNSKQSRWMDLFSDLDPLANLDAFDLKLSGGCTSSQPT